MQGPYLCGMPSDERYLKAKNLIESGYSKSFRQIFDVLPKSIMAKDCGMNNTRFTRLMHNVEQFSLEELIKIARFLDVELETVIGLILQQYYSDHNIKKGKRYPERAKTPDVDTPGVTN
jgi:hypothetical protein